MEKAKDFTDLEVWKKAHEIALLIYRLTQKFPNSEKFGLISQMRRAAISVPANIAEGFYRRGKRDKANFYTIAQGSLQELRYYMILSKDLRYIDSNEELIEQIISASMMINKLITSILS
ncbi:MAG: four helix bundle protein [bacterium]